MDYEFTLKGHNMFNSISDAVNKRFMELQNLSETLYTVDISRDEIWDAYLNAYTPEDNPIFQERTVHDCTTCKQFIRNVGNVVAIFDGKLHTIWDNQLDDKVYNAVSRVMEDLIRSKPITNVFFHNEPKVGKQFTPALLKDGSTITFNHFYGDVIPKFYNRDIQNATHPFRTNAEMLKRAMTELTLDAALTIIDLVKQDSIYRGSEHLQTLEMFVTTKKAYDSADNKELFVWSNVRNHAVCRVRNTVIGSLLIDLSEGKDLEASVKSFETKVAPTNYKRPTALITPKMIELAVTKINELGIQDSLKRRYAQFDDISVNNVIFADKDSVVQMKDSLTSMLMTQAKKSVPNFDKVEEISIEDFIKNVVPTANTIELMIENSHLSNFCSLIAPAVSDSPNILQWDNNFSWAYNGGVTDSIKQHVKNAGGNVDGDLRISLSWINDDDLDLHCYTPTESHIFYGDKRPYGTKGQLDVDMRRGGTPSKPSVENIFWINQKDVHKGKHEIKVHQYSKNTTIDQGFIVEIEFNGQLWNFVSTTNGKTEDMFDICDIYFDGKNITVTKTNQALTDQQSSKQLWNVSTNEFHKVSTLMLSPNHWDDNAYGNKHYMFMLQDCKNPDAIRGLYNEFLSPSLNEHRKVFEVLGDQIKCEPSDKQLSGLGFSSTQRNSIVCKVSGNVNRMLKINF